MNSDPRSATAIATLFLLSSVVGVAVIGTPVSATSSTSHDNGIGANYTVVLPNEASHQPGADGADIHHLAAANGMFEETSSPKGLKRMDTLTIWSDDIDFGSCSTQNTKAFGIDRGNDDSGTQTDEGLLQHRKDSSFNRHSIYVNFYGKGAIAGDPVSYNAEDQIVAVQTGCYGMPDQPGWYQISARINGTGYNGNYIDSADRGTIRSHYFYVCDCSSRQEAEKKLGPPPSQQGSSDSSGSSGGSTPTPTRAPTENSGGGGGSGSGGGGGGGGSTPTPTSAPTENSGGGAGSGGGYHTGTPGATSRATATSASTQSSGGRRTSTGSNGSSSTATVSPSGTSSTGGSNGSAPTGGGSNGSSEGGGVLTPTAGAGPGFGVLAAFWALVGAVLLGRRRGN